MFANPTIAKVEALGLSGMVAALATSSPPPDQWNELAFDASACSPGKQADARDSLRLATRLKAAELRYPAAVEDLDVRTPEACIEPRSSNSPAAAGSPDVRLTEPNDGSGLL